MSRHRRPGYCHRKRDDRRTACHVVASNENSSRVAWPRKDEGDRELETVSPGPCDEGRVGDVRIMNCTL